MSRLRHVTIPFVLLSSGLSLALAAMACSLVSPTAIRDSSNVPAMHPSPTVLASKPSPSQAAEDSVESPPASEEPSGETSEYNGDFAEADCACADYQPSQTLPWGNTSLICRYDWSGPNIDQNALGSNISHYYHTDQLLPDFQQDVEGLRASLPPQRWRGITRDGNCATMTKATGS